MDGLKLKQLKEMTWAHLVSEKGFHTTGDFTKTGDFLLGTSLVENLPNFK